MYACIYYIFIYVYIFSFIINKIILNNLNNFLKYIYKQCLHYIVMNKYLLYIFDN